MGGPARGWGGSPRPSPPAPALQQSLLTMEEIQSVEETQIKERKCLLLKIRGGKQFVLQCDVSGDSGWGRGRSRMAGAGSDGAGPECGWGGARRAGSA